MGVAKARQLAAKPYAQKFAMFTVFEANFLAKLPGNYRLSCCVNTYGDIIVETRPPTGKKLIEFM